LKSRYTARSPYMIIGTMTKSVIISFTPVTRTQHLLHYYYYFLLLIFFTKYPQNKVPEGYYDYDYYHYFFPGVKIKN